MNVVLEGRLTVSRGLKSRPLSCLCFVYLRQGLTLQLWLFHNYMCTICVDQAGLGQGLSLSASSFHCLFASQKVQLKVPVEVRGQRSEEGVRFPLELGIEP